MGKVQAFFCLALIKLNAGTLIFATSSAEQSASFYLYIST